MRTLAALACLWLVCTPVQGAGADTNLVTAQLGSLERHTSDGKKSFGTFPDLMDEFQMHIAFCVQSFKPKSAGGSNPKADAKSLQECMKRDFNENILEPISRRVYPNEQLSSCK
jgi:hypothetical protein